MPRAICWGLIGAVIGVAVFSLATEYAGCQPGFLPRLGNVVAAPMSKLAAEIAAGPEGTAVQAADASPLLDALLPDPAQLTADWPLSEPIDLLTSREMASPPRQNDGRAPEEVVPAAAIRSADEAECFRPMPYCEIPELLPLMPHVEETTSAGDGTVAAYRVVSSAKAARETQAPQQLSADPKVLQERLNRVLQSYLQGRRYPERAGVDTMEFRPSDAKRGEFDRLPF